MAAELIGSRLLHGAPVDEVSQCGHHIGDRCANQQTDSRARSDRDNRREQNIELGLSADESAQLRRDKRSQKRAERFAGAGQCDGAFREDGARNDLGGECANQTCHAARDDDQRRALIFGGNADADTRTGQRLRERCGRADVEGGRAGEECGDLRENGADNQCGKQAERHSGQTVNKHMPQIPDDCGTALFVRQANLPFCCNYS